MQSPTGSSVVDPSDKGFKVSVQVGKNPGMHFEMPIGNGDQTVRWLGLAASQRYTMELRANGRARQREGNLTEIGNFLPGGVYLRGFSHSDPIDPSTPLKSVVENNKEFLVKLLQEIEIDDDGAPRISYWSAKAFKHSTHGKEQAEEYEKRRLQREAKEPLRIARAAKESKISTAEEDLEVEDELNGISILEDNAKLKALFDADWSLINAIDVLGTESLAQEARKLVEANYPELMRVLSRFSRRQKTREIVYMDCLHCIHQCGVLNLKEKNAYDIALFNQCAHEATNCPPGAYPTLKRHQFIDLLLRLAVKRAKSSMIGAELKRILQERIAAIATLFKNTGVKVRAAMNKSLELKQIIHENLPVLETMFGRYAMTATDTCAPPTLTLQELHLIFRDTDMVPGFDEVNMYQCTRKIFQQCQQLDGSKAEPLGNIVFCEFLEATMLMMGEKNSLFTADFVECFREVVFKLQVMNDDADSGESKHK